MFFLCLQEFYFETRKSDTPISKFLSTIEKKSVDYAKEKKWPTFLPADEYLMACALDCDVIKSCVNVFATVELKGQFTWGQMVVDWKNTLQKPKNVRIVTALDQEKFESKLRALVE